MDTFIPDANDVVIFEFEEASPGGVVRSASAAGVQFKVGSDAFNQLVAKSKDALKSGMNRIYQMSAHTLEVIKAMDKRPDQVEVSFGLKFSGEGLAVVAKTSGEAALNIKLVWKSDQE